MPSDFSDVVSSLDPQEQEIITLYRSASPDDRLVIDAVLNKYRSPLTKQTTEAV